MLVGGSVRDAIDQRFRFIAKDFDFIIRRDLVDSAASKVKSELGGTIVRLKFEQTVRVVLKGGTVVDLSAPNGDCLDVDLANRDYTINSIGWSPKECFIDKQNGSGDIRRGVVRAIREQNLNDDPLRVLRAYRFVAERGYKIHLKTRGLLNKYAKRIIEPARERVTEEMIRILNSDNALAALKLALDDGLLQIVFAQDISAIKNKLQLIKRLDGNKREQTFGLTGVGLIRLELLMFGANLDDTRLVLSNEARKRVESFSRAYSRKVPAARSEALYELFGKAGGSALDVLRATHREDLRCELQRYQRIQKREIVSADEIIASGVERGPGLGRLIKEIQMLRFMGKLKTNKDCMLYINSLKQHYVNRLLS